MLVLLFVKLLFYVLGATCTGLLVRELVYLRRAPPLTRHSFTLKDQKQLLQRLYADEALDLALAQAGLPWRITAWQYRFYRDSLFLLSAAALHLRFLVIHVYPTATVIFLAIAYGLCLGGKPFMPVYLLLGMLRKESLAKKNNELFDLYLLLSNDYEAESSVEYQSVYSKLKEYSVYTRTIRPDVNRLLSDYTTRGKEAYRQFGKQVGTKEAEVLGRILAQIDASTPETARDLLAGNYETFAEIRRQRRRKKLKTNGYYGHVVVLIAIISVIYFLTIYTNVYKSSLTDILNTTT